MNCSGPERATELFLNIYRNIINEYKINIKKGCKNERMDHTRDH